MMSFFELMYTGIPYSSITARNRDSFSPMFPTATAISRKRAPARTQSRMEEAQASNSSRSLRHVQRRILSVGPNAAGLSLKQ